jgi:hypothetical protein
MASRAVAADLDHEHGAGVALHEEAVPRLLEVGLGAFEDVAVDQLAAVGPVRMAMSVACSASWMVAKCAHISAPGGGSGSTVELELHAEEERALGAGEQLAEVEGPVRGRVEDLHAISRSSA